MNKIYVNTSLLLASILFSLLLGEFITRKANLSKTWSSYLDEKLFLDYQTIYGDKIGHRRRPDVTFTSVRGAIYNINSLGFRDRNIANGKNGKKRIAFLGDSVTEGFGVAENDRFSNLLEKYLNEDSYSVETLNFAIAGHNTMDQLTVLRNYVIQFKPDYIFLQMCFNDIGENYEDVNPQLKYVSNTIKKPNALISFLQKHSAFYLLLAERYHYQKLNAGIPNALVPTAESVNDEKWLWTVHLLDEFHKICKEHNIQLILTYSPLEVEVIIKEEQQGNLVNEKIKNYCSSRKIEFLNLLVPLRIYDKGPRQTLFIDDVHLSGSGHGVVAGKLVNMFEVKLNESPH